MAITTNITNFGKAHDKGEGGGTTIIYGNNNTSGAGGDLSLSSITAGVGTIKKLSGNQINYNEGAITYFASGDGTITKLKGEELKYTKAKIGELISNSIDNSGSISTKDISADNAWLKELQSNKITTEYLTVTKQAHFFELIIDKVKSVGGTMIMTAANAVIDYSKAVDSNGDYLSSLTDPNAAYYDVFWLAQESNGRKVTNDWMQYDQAYCQSFNNVSQGVNYDVQNKYYWRLVTAVLADRYMNLNTGAELALSQAAQATVNSVYINTPRILYVTDNTDTTINTGWNGNAQTLDDIITGTTWTQTSGGSNVLQGTMTTTNTVFGIELKPVADSTLTQANGSKFILDCSSARLNIGIYYTDGTSEWFPAPDNATTHYEYILKAEYDSTNNVYVSTNTSIIEAVVITNADEVAWKLVHGIRLSNTICDATVVSNTSSIPTAGDNISQLGYRYNELQNPTDTDIERASAIIISACQTPDKGEIGPQGPQGQQSTIRGITPPSYAQYEHITDFHLSRYRGTFMDAKGSEFHGEFIATNGQTIEEMIEEMETSDYQLFIAYSNASDGSVDFTKTPVSGQTYSYMGYCSKPIPPGETYQSVELTLVASDYKWSLVPSSSGTPGGNWVYAYKVTNSATTAPLPPNVNNVPKALSELPYDGWYSTPQSATTSEYIWQTKSFISGTGNQQLWENAVRLTGIAGTDGTDGTDGSDGTSVTITGKVTTYAVTTTSTQPADSAFIYYSIPQLDLGDYLWTRMVITFSDNNSIKSYSVSRIGTDGSDGDDGLDGKTTHWAYATSADGSQNFSTTLFAGATYVGTYDDYTRADSTDYRDYSWTKLKGENGEDGTSITITSREVVYQISSSGTTVPTGNWSSTVPAPQQGKYLWTRTTVTYSDNSTTVAYSVSYYGADGTGQDAEYYTYFPLIERAIVDSSGTLGVYLQYKIAHVVGTTVTYIDASDSGYHMRAKGNNNTSTYLSFTADTTNHVSTYQNEYYMVNYPTQSSKPIYFNIYLTKGTNHTVVAQSVVAVIFDAAATLTITDGIQATVSGHTESIQQINTDINNIGIPNLVMNGAFKKGATYWTNWGTPTTREITTDANGNKWMHIVSDPSSVTGTNKNWQGYSQNHYTDYDITVEAGQKYTVSLMAYAGSGTPTICVGFHWFNVGNTSTVNSQVWNTWTINGTPTKYTWTLTIPSGIDHFNIMVGDNTTSVQNFYISFIKMEKGEVATDWTPSIVETDASITTLNTGYSQLSQNYNSINATVQGHTTSINEMTGEISGMQSDISELEMTASSITSTVSRLEGFDHRNYFAFNRGIKPNSNSCMLYPYEYGLVGWGSDDAIINFGFNKNDIGSTWTCSFQLNSNTTVNVSPTFCGQTPIKIYKNGSEYSSNTTISNVGSTFNNYVVVWGSISASQLTSASENGILKFAKSNSSARITVKNICLTKGQYKDLAFEVAPEDLEYQGSQQPFQFNYNNMVPDGEYRGLDVYTSNINPTYSNQNMDLIVYNEFTIKDKTPYTLSFWAKSDMNNTFIRHYLYNGSWNLHAGSEYGTTENNGADGSWKTDLSTTWNHYTVHWMSHVNSITGSDSSQKLIKNIIGLRLQYASDYNNQSAKVSIAGMTFQEGWVDDGAGTSSSLIKQTADEILLQVGECGINIDERNITLNGDTNVNGTLTLNDDEQGFMLVGLNGKTQITPKSIGTYDNFISNASPNVLVSKTTTVQAQPYGIGSTSTTASWYVSNSFGTVPSGTLITLSNQSLTFRNVNSGNSLLPTVSNTYKVYINGSLVQTYTNSSRSSSSVGYFTTSSQGELRVDFTCNAIFNTSSLINNSVIGSINYYITLPKDIFTMIGYDGIASNFGNNSNVYFGPQAAYLRYGNHGLKITSDGIMKLNPNGNGNYTTLDTVKVKNITNSDVSSNTYNVVALDEFLVVNRPGTTYIQLPDASYHIGRKLYIKNIYDGGNIYLKGSIRVHDDVDIASQIEIGNWSTMVLSDGTAWVRFHGGH